MGLDTRWNNPAASKTLTDKRKHDRQIIVRLWGGLGNQMFQYAFGLALSRKTGLPLKADVSYFNNQPSIDTPRHYELGDFDVKLDFASAEELPRKKKTPCEKLILLMGGSLPLRKVSEKHYYRYDAELLGSIGKKQSLYLDGYWQCPEYFEDVRAELLACFSLVKPLNSTETAEAQAIKNHVSIALHVRRGDYLSNPNAAQVHNLCPKEYYSRAMDYLAQQESEAHFMIFSDDIPWCQAELPLPFPHSFVNFEPSYSALGIYLMSLCKHHIIANSSYSWWGAWLAQNPNKLVIAPKQWLHPQHPNSTAEGLIPSTWIRM